MSFETASVTTRKCKWLHIPPQHPVLPAPYSQFPPYGSPLLSRLLSFPLLPLVLLVPGVLGPAGLSQGPQSLPFCSSMAVTSFPLLPGAPWCSHIPILPRSCGRCSAHPMCQGQHLPPTYTKSLFSPAPPRPDPAAKGEYRCFSGCVRPPARVLCVRPPARVLCVSPCMCAAGTLGPQGSSRAQGRGNPKDWHPEMPFTAHPNFLLLLLCAALCPSSACSPCAGSGQ